MPGANDDAVMSMYFLGIVYEFLVISIVACKLFNDAVEDSTNVNLLPGITLLAPVAVPVASDVFTDIDDMPVILTPFICIAAVHVPEPDSILSSFTEYAYSAYRSSV